MTGLVGGPLLMGGLGPGPPAPPLNPALRVRLFNQTRRNKFVRPRWPYDMRPSVRAEKYIRYVGP